MSWLEAIVYTLGILVGGTVALFILVVVSDVKKTAAATWKERYEKRDKDYEALLEAHRAMLENHHLEGDRQWGSSTTS